MDKETTIKNEAIWKPVIIRNQEVTRHPEGYDNTKEKGYYHYTILTQEEVVLYNENTGEFKHIPLSKSN